MNQMNGPYAFSLLIKPVSMACNLDCLYCFYKRAVDVFGDKESYVMDDSVLRTMINNYMSLGFPFPAFGWQGGEPALAGLDFYERVVKYQKQYGSPGQAVSNGFQTNGLLIDDHWSQFFKEYNFLIGLSMDGPEKFHDHYRLAYDGKGTFSRVMKAVEVMEKNKTEYNILTVLTDHNIEHVEELYVFFVSNKFRFLQFIPCLETDPSTGKTLPYSVKPGQYGKFLCGLFDLWYENGFPDVSIRFFDSILSYYIDGVFSQCTMHKECDAYLLVEHSGDVFPCDFFVYDEWNLGNLTETGLGDLFAGQRFKEFRSMKSRLNKRCLLCKWLFLCHGDCTRYRLVQNSNPENLAYFCQSMERFYSYTDARFKELAERVRQIRQEKQDCSASGKKLCP